MEKLKQFLQGCKGFSSCYYLNHKDMIFCIIMIVFVLNEYRCGSYRGLVWHKTNKRPVGQFAHLKTSLYQ